MMQPDPDPRAVEDASVTPRHAQDVPRGIGVRVLKYVGMALAVVLVSTVSVAAITTWQLRNNITTIAIPGDEESIADVGKIRGGFNILLVGSDECAEKCAGYGVRTNRLNDVTMLLHVAEDQQSAVAVSIPRDLVVPIPSCPMEDGSGSYPAMSAQPINTTLAYGGLACTVMTVREMSGLKIQFAGLITFTGVIAMSNAVGGVPVCITGDLDDENTGLHLKKGTTVLKGKDALQFLRTRHGIGDNSDLARISSQQVFMSSLVRTLKSSETLSDLGKVFALAQATTQNVDLSKNFADPNTLVSIALALKDIPLTGINFVQFPTVTGVGEAYEGKLAPDQEQADRLWKLIKDDVSFSLAQAGDDIGATTDPSATEPDADAPTSSATDAPQPSRTDAPTGSPKPTAGASETPKPQPTVPFRGVPADTKTCSVTN
jgi:LCP family protein required for cell wall assembly